MSEGAGLVESIDSYLESLSEGELRAVAARSVKSLDDAHRAQLALLLGNEETDERDLRQSLERCESLRDRFATFLHENPRAVPALGRRIAREILKDDFEQTPLAGSLSFPHGLLTAMLLVLLVALVPVAAQYLHERGVLANQFEFAYAVARPKHAVHKRLVTHHVIRPSVAHSTPVAHVRVVPLRRTHVRRIAFTPHPKKHRVMHRRSSRRMVRRLVAELPFTIPASDAFGTRAGVLVRAYLRAVIEGNTAAALEHLGLPPDANAAANVRESSIVSRDTRVQIASVRREQDGTARVEADLIGRAGEYFEVFSVSPDGPAARISDRFYIPVDRTAQERAAMLAEGGH